MFVKTLKQYLLYDKLFLCVCYDDDDLKYNPESSLKHFLSCSIEYSIYSLVEQIFIQSIPCAGHSILSHSQQALNDE